VPLNSADYPEEQPQVSILPAAAQANRASIRGSSAQRFLFAITSLLLVGGITAAIVVFWAQGGRWFIVETPSMGEAMPVGTLVVTTPVAVTSLSVGDIITFHPPSEPSRIYSHRITRIDPNAVVHTRGDINGAEDPWGLQETNIIGRATAVLPGWGWLVRALPYLVIGFILVWLLVSWLFPRTWRAPALFIGFPLVVSVTAVIIRPFVGVTVLTTTTTDGLPTTTIVSTGLLPIRAKINTAGSTSVDLVSGQVGSITTSTPSAESFYHLNTIVNLSPWEWGIALLVCASPLVWCLIAGLASAKVGSARGALSHNNKRRLA